MPDEPPVAGSHLHEVVEVVDRLMSPGGDDWVRQQTHESLARFMLEEAYEAYDAIESGSLDALREELGDVLFQVVLHARLAEDGPQPWSIEDVAETIAAKLVRRNPHVFAGLEVSSVAEIMANWERIKSGEKVRETVLDGVALSQPALALATKICARARSAGRSAVVASSVPTPEVGDADELGELLFALVEQASARGLDAEGALRRVALRRAQALRAEQDPAVRPGPSGVQTGAVRPDGPAPA